MRGDVPGDHKGRPYGSSLRSHGTTRCAPTPLRHALRGPPLPFGKVGRAGGAFENDITGERIATHLRCAPGGIFDKVLRAYEARRGRIFDCVRKWT